MTGTTSYGTFVFPVNTETVGYSIRPIYDQAGRTVVYNVLSITLAAKIYLGESITIGGATYDLTNAASIETVMALIRSELTKPALPLVYTDMGMGALSVNVPGGTMKDVAWGPKPQILALQHLAGANAISLQWSCEVATVLCGDAVFENQPLEFNYSVTYNLDRSGYTTRSVDGFVRIPLTRRFGADRRLTTSADDWRAKITPALLSGFRRVYGPFVLSPDRTRLDFSIRDEEMGPGALPEGVVDADISHTMVNASQPLGFSRWLMTFDASIEMSRDWPPESAWDAFYELLRKRLDYTKNQLTGFAAVRTPAARENVPRKCFILPMQLRCTERGITGKPSTQFTFVYSVISSFETILKNSALWQPLDTSWDRWSASLAGTAFHSRGSARLKYNPADDAIVDLCLSQGVKTIKGEKQPETPEEMIIRQAAGPCPEPIDSWVMYQNEIHVEDAQNTSVHVPLPVTRLQLDPITSGFFDPQPIGYNVATFKEQPEAKVQTRAGANYYVWMTGYALRVCYPIVPPELRKVQNIDVTPANRSDRDEGFKTWIAGYVGHTLYGASWRLRYILPSPRFGGLIATPVPLFPGGASMSGSGVYDPRLDQIGV